jgi:mRNA interferase YafQ
MLKRGKDREKLKTVIRLLVSGGALPERYREHKLRGNFTGRHECHLESDWLVVYKLDNDEVIFERTGTHTDLFD